MTVWRETFWKQKGDDHIYSSSRSRSSSSVATISLSLRTRPLFASALGKVERIQARSEKLKESKRARKSWKKPSALGKVEKNPSALGKKSECFLHLLIWCTMLIWYTIRIQLQKWDTLNTFGDNKYQIYNARAYIKFFQIHFLVTSSKWYNIFCIRHRQD